MLDILIDMEDKFINNKRRIPNTIKMNYQHYLKLVKELESNYFLNCIHGMEIQIIPTSKIIIE